MELVIIGAVVIAWLMDDILLTWLDDRYHAQYVERQKRLPRFQTYYYKHVNRVGNYVTIYRLTNAEALNDDGSVKLGVHVWVIQD